MILEIAVFTIKPGHADAFAAAYHRAAELIASSPGCLSTRMTRGVENPDEFTLLVEWETLEAHLEGFRGSDRFHRWRAAIGEHLDGADVRHATNLT
ncbi:MAG TPA: antibiotic biosynthesis monooxygenase family protein [Kineosporiaceae bacterium]